MPAPYAPATDRVDRALTAATGTSVRVERAVHLAPWSVMRCQLADPLPNGATSVIVKWVRTDAGNERTQPTRLRTERAALELVGAYAARLVPRVLSGGGDSGLLVLEDLAPREPLRELILREGPAAARQELIAFARALGRLHATTAGHADAYYQRLGRVRPPEWPTTSSSPSASGNSGSSFCAARACRCRQQPRTNWPTSSTSYCIPGRSARCRTAIPSRTTTSRTARTGG
ncbi:MAG TPA: hypothetical protein VIM10_13075 [Actinopolymorphaceae bacterium]